MCHAPLLQMAKLALFLLFSTLIVRPVLAQDYIQIEKNPELSNSADQETTEPESEQQETDDLKSEAQEESIPGFWFVHFQSEQWYISDYSKGLIKKNAQWFLEHPQYQIHVDGHCDDPGTIPYNFDLGQKRADEVKEILI